MKRAMLLFATAALTACGSPANGPSATKSATPATGNGVYFVPRGAMPVLGGKLKVVGQHDSGILVEAPVADEQDLLKKIPQSFRFDQWKPEVSAYDFDSMEAKVKQITQQYPQLAASSVYATSTEGRAEYLLTLEDKTQTGPKTDVLITGATHGNETSTVDVVLGLTDKLLQGQTSDARLQAMLKNHRIFVVPAVCVDSYVAETRAAEGVDPNRSYPYPDQPTATPPKCIADIMNLVDTHNFVATLDYHDAASMVFFPWAYTYDQIPQADYQKLDALTTKMASQNGFDHGQIAQTIYIAPGSSADYYYWKHHAAATAIELSHNEASSDPTDLVDEVTESTWSFIEGANTLQ